MMAQPTEITQFIFGESLSGQNLTHAAVDGPLVDPIAAVPGIRADHL
jgi:hypothetical protein